ncbi:hypothetical protein BKA66DRAFT_470951 [Pyrenochaeta sp. MPI-SDFR-AT-0127]|nr:hypothetical protein BKA66DRAFT_470951 [Pyrenochaeta sp. MPI-SDFR-AT-0127]
MVLTAMYPLGLHQTLLLLTLATDRPYANMAVSSTAKFTGEKDLLSLTSSRPKVKLAITSSHAPSSMTTTSALSQLPLAIRSLSFVPGIIAVCVVGPPYTPASHTLTRQCGSCARGAETWPRPPQAPTQPITTPHPRALQLSCRPPPAPW